MGLPAMEEFMSINRSPLGKLLLDILLHIKVTGSCQVGIALSNQMFQVRVQASLKWIGDQFASQNLSWS